jgi:four helix bundle protein
MNENQKKYYSRFSKYAIDCAQLIQKLDWQLISNKEWGKQLIRSSGSIAANYIEAIEAVSNADFIYRYNICRKEANESVHWLYLLRQTNNRNLYEIFNRLIDEGRQFVKIFSSSIETKKNNMKQYAK